MAKLKYRKVAMTAADHTQANWQMIRHVYSAWVKLDGNRLRNLGLDKNHFRALVLACRTKIFGKRDRKDDSLLNAIGNWLYSREFGAWRNPNRDKPYDRGRTNKERWDEFCCRLCAESRDYSLRRARAEA
jgi:hypothetical protein